jgi:formamidopyrimidine-DNA glycosylase
MPELPEVQAHCERLTERYGGLVLQRFTPITFTALKTASPPPDTAHGEALRAVTRRGKYLLADFGATTFVIHLMQGGRLKEEAEGKQKARPGGGQARWLFDDGRAWLLTERGTERRAGVWTATTATVLDGPPLADLGPEAMEIDAPTLLARFHDRNQRVHGFLRHQGCIAGIGRRLANEICWEARQSPFAMTGKLGLDDAQAIVDAIHRTCEEGLAYERTRNDMSASADRPGAVHGRAGDACPRDGDTIRSVKYSSYTVAYCPTCQTSGKVLADNTTSRFLK